MLQYISGQLVLQGGRGLSAMREKRDVEASQMLEMEVRGGLALVAVDGRTGRWWLGEAASDEGGFKGCPGMVSAAVVQGGRFELDNGGWVEC